MFKKKIVKNTKAKIVKNTKAKIVKNTKAKIVKNTEKDYGSSAGIPTYEPILNFNPCNEDDFIIVKMDHALLDDMLKELSKKKAKAVGVLCRRI